MQGGLSFRGQANRQVEAALVDAGLCVFSSEDQSLSLAEYKM